MEDHDRDPHVGDEAHRKQDNYAYYLRRHKIAMRNAFYYEALLIDYAMLEDRLQLLLYYSGVLKEKEDKRVFSQTRPLIRNIYETYGDDHNGIYRVLPFQRVSE